MIRFGQCLDHANALGVFPHDGNHPVLCPLNLGKHRNTLGRFGVNQKCDKRQRRQHHQRQHRLHYQRDHNSPDQQDRRADAHSLNHADHPMDIVGVAGQTAFQRWNRKFIPLAARQSDRFFKQIMPDVNRGVPGYARGKPIGLNVKNPARDGHGDHDQTVNYNPLNVLRRHDRINHIRQQIRQKQNRQRPQRLHQKADRHLFQQRFQVFLQEFHNRFPFPLRILSFLYQQLAS